MNRATDNLHMEQVLDADIGGTNATSEYVDLSLYESVCFTIQMGHTDGDTTFTGWDSTDELDSLLVLEAASDVSAAGSSQTLDDYSANTVVDNGGAGRDAGTRYQINVGAEELSAGYTHVAVKVAEASNTGVDFVHVFATGINAKQAIQNRSGLTSASYILS